ncbi:MAG: tRNA uridine-5-carboxymethylaminomethyl(34) synthesis GTPase MnmE [Clostridiales bacterium]|nr:tRNA uridine-5-carboxymethylaminomethyl(34) synthesis GTPase MnmE [Clostridiales bacterium]
MEDTIAAIATAYGEGGIGIIRISGECSFSVLNSIFVPQTSETLEGRKLTYGKITDPQSGETIDEVLAVFMKGPKTYTTEDVAEIYCHGSVVALRKTLAAALRNGARMAEPGEFTKRAFLNGRLDLSQAESVIDMVKAKTDKSFDVALSQLEGNLSAKVSEIRIKLLDLLVDLAVNIDYPDEDIEEIEYDNLEEKTLSIGNLIEKLLSTASTGRMIREGIRVAIVGKPNVGKSSLMNGLMKESRAIVTEIPGTTRDTIEEVISIRSIPVYLIDTAGIRQTSNKVELLGIEKSKQAFNSADFVIFIIDGSQELTREDFEIIQYLKTRKTLVLINKKDIGQKILEENIKELLPDAEIAHTALLKGEGVEDVEETIERLVYGGEISQSESLLVNNLRHTELLKKGRDYLTDALDMTKKREALDIIEIDIRAAYEELGEIIGETVSEDIIDEVFARFCLGK